MPPLLAGKRLQQCTGEVRKNLLILVLQEFEVLPIKVLMGVIDNGSSHFVRTVNPKLFILQLH